MDEKALKSWVSQQLHTLLGFAESHVSSYIIAVAKKHTSPESLAVVLRSQGLPPGSETNSFAGALIQRLQGSSSAAPRSASADEVARAKALVRKNRQYGLLEDDLEPGGEPSTSMPPPPDRPESGKGASKHKERSLRKTREACAGDDEDAGGVGAALPSIKRRKRAWEEDEENEAEREARRAGAVHMCACVRALGYPMHACML